MSSWPRARSSFQSPKSPLRQRVCHASCGSSRWPRATTLIAAESPNRSKISAVSRDERSNPSSKLSVTRCMPRLLAGVRLDARARQRDRPLAVDLDPFAAGASALARLELHLRPVHAQHGVVPVSDLFGDALHVV